MDAIFGILHLDDTLVHQTLLERMARAFEVVPERQSALSISCGGPIGFGRLTIGKTPVASPPTEMEDLLCVLDARLYRAPDTNVPLDMSSSTRESLLSGLHARFGDEAPNHLEGDFAYAIWDKNRRNLKLVRDHMSVRPLFYFCEPEKFMLWASHSDFILVSGLVPNDLDIAAACRDLVGDTSDMEGTAIRGLKRLPAAHILNVSADGQIQLKRYWSLECTNPISAASNFNQSALRLRRLLDNAVGRASETSSPPYFDFQL